MRFEPGSVLRCGVVDPTGFGKEGMAVTSEEKRQKAQINRLMAKGPIDLPFALLVLLLTAIGVLMVFSASLPGRFMKRKTLRPWRR